MRKMGNMNLCASQTRPYENIRLKIKFSLVNAISHIWKKGKEGERLGFTVEKERNEEEKKKNEDEKRRRSRFETLVWKFGTHVWKFGTCMESFRTYLEILFGNFCWNSCLG